MKKTFALIVCLLFLPLGLMGTAILGTSNQQVTGSLTAGTTATKNPVAINTKTTQAHGLGSSPVLVVMYLECLTAELNYSIGDRVLVQTTNNAAGNFGYSVEYDLTNVVILVGNQPPQIHDKNTPAAITPITTANWKIVAIPYKMN